MNGSLEQLERFMSLLHKVQRVQRFARRPDEQIMNNTAEHTFEVALSAWYLHDVEQTGLNLEKILTYALAHDIIEAYAGDTYAHDPEAQKTKVAREEKALQRIKKEFSEFPSLINTIEEYEQKETPESRFVYALDKIVDPLNASMETTQSIWRERNMSFETICDYKDLKVAHSSLIQKYWEAIKNKLKRNHSFFFN